MSDERERQTGQTAKSSESKWGDPISPERQAELQSILDRWDAEMDHGERKGPFDGIRLTGADAFWLEGHSYGKSSVRSDGAILLGSYNLHLEGANLAGAHLEGAVFEGAHLEDANLNDAKLANSNFEVARLERASLRGAHLEHAYLGMAHLDGAHLEGAHLEGANLQWAHLERADLEGAHLEGDNLLETHLEGASLIAASFDKSSNLNDAILSGAFFDQVIFDNTNLTVVDWSLVSILGDERWARERRTRESTPKTRGQNLTLFRAAVRANRMLSVSLSAQGLAEDGDRFAYRAQLLQRRVFWYQRKLGAYLFSWLLAGLAGYGYRLGRIFIVYGLAVLLFAIGYFLSGGVTGQSQPQAHLSLLQQALDALQVSLNAIHGRVFFTQLGLDTLQSWLATLESIAGIVIEGVFVAMLIQRFFSR